MDYTNKSNVYYENLRPEMQELLPKDAKVILDVGCGRGAMAYSLMQKFNLEAWGIEFMKEEAEVAKSKLNVVISESIENALPQLPDKHFDVIYFNDVLEHLAYPYDVLKSIQSKLSPNGVVISSIPNVRYHSVMKQYLFKKDWKYEKSGVMDFTHMRFFTSKSIQRMYHDAGYDIVQHKGINKTKSFMPYIYNLFLLFSAMDSFYVQYATVVRKKR